MERERIFKQKNINLIRIHFENGSWVLQYNYNDLLTMETYISLSNYTTFNSLILAIKELNKYHILPQNEWGVDVKFNIFDLTNIEV